MTEPTDRYFTVSNLLTTFRLLLVIPLVYLLETEQIGAALTVIGLAVASDFLDGYVARRTGQITNLGKLLDPIADTVLMVGVMIFLIFNTERQFSIYFLLLLGIRDITLSNIATYLMNRQSLVFQTNRTGKWFATATAVAMTLYVLKYNIAGLWALGIATILLLTSWYYYLRRYIRYFKTLVE